MAKPKRARKPRTARSVQNVFGENSPHQNLPFPTTTCNLTSAEIVAYLPHWMRSVDVIDRFVNNGSKSATLANMLNVFRLQPDDVRITANSVCLVMQSSMRGAGYVGWKKGNHANLVKRDDNGDEFKWDGSIIDVSTFRTPYETHHSKRLRFKDSQADPIDFKDLALHVKKHPDGDDALDLTRCVEHALSHPEETFLFPTDYQRLVMLIGGPERITSAHLDKQLFARYESGLKDYNLDIFPSFVPFAVRPNTKLMAPPVSRSVQKAKSNHPSITRKVDQVDNEPVSISHSGSTRQSGRLAIKPSVNFNDDFSDPESPFQSTPKAHNDFTLTRKRKITVEDEDFKDFNEEPSSASVKGDYEVSDELFTPASALTVSKRRRAASKARRSIQEISAFQLPKVFNGKVPQAAFPPISPTLMSAARAFSSRQPKLLKPPVLSRERLRVDEHSVWLYSEDTCTTMAERWDSALSSTRFNGPRTSAPYRELYRLTDPPAWDVSDWAENIRWAKEQEKVFGSRTWTEYDYHLEQITEERRDTRWVSEEAIESGL